ncbi:MAG: hypothetical protein HY701_14320, partial [Gemmatimonadetes bacterium]|nr:hypothetical protein [Gemmatimonadota bacterium]
MKSIHRMKRQHLLLIVAVLVGGALGSGFDRVLAQQTGITRTILLRTDEPGAA